MRFDEFWDDFDFGFGPFRIFLGPFGRNMRYRRAVDSHILDIRIDPAVKKEDIKVRLVEPGLIELKWPRRKLEGDIPVD
jgi:hypothetical protein